MFVWHTLFTNFII